MGRKNIPTQENDKTLSSKIFVRNDGIPEKDIHCVNCNFIQGQEKIEAAEKYIQNNESTKCKKRKEGCEFIELL